LAEAMISEIEGRGRAGQAIAVPHVNEIESSPRIGEKYRGVFACAVDRFELQSEDVIPTLQLESAMARRYFVYADTGANTVKTVDQAIRDIASRYNLSVTRIRVVVMRADYASVGSALDIIKTVLETAPHELSRLVLVCNYSTAQYAALDSDLKNFIDSCRDQVAKGRGTVCDLTWCDQFPTAGIKHAIGNLRGDLAIKTMGAADASAWLDNIPRSASPIEIREQAKVVERARKVGEWVDQGLMSVASAIVDHVERVFRDLGGNVVQFDMDKGQQPKAA
jgi:hypothetical protein